MRFFFRSRQFKIIAAVLAVIIAISAVAVAIKGFVTPQTNILGSLFAPIQKLSASISESIEVYKKRTADNNELMLENEKLKDKLSEATDKLLEYEDLEKENSYLKDYLGIKDEHKDFQFAPAMMIAIDSIDPYGGFTINCGKLDGVSLHDPVITDEGLVGYISEVGLSFSKVTTILSPELTVGAYDKRTRDVGAVSGSLEFSEDGNTKLFNLTRNCSVTVGDYIVTSGGGIFPEGLLIGTVESVDQEKHNASLYATLSTAVDFENLSELMVITYFSGQGTISDIAGE